MSFAPEDVDMDAQPHVGEDVTMAPLPKAALVVDGEEEEEGEGDVIEQGKNISDDSSEEEEEDEEAERRVREGFIVDEDEDDDGDGEEDEDEEEQRRRKRRKHKHKQKHKNRKREKEEDEDDDLDEDDLDLLEENTGRRVAGSKLTRLRRGRGSDDEAAGGSSRRRVNDESSDEGIDEANIIGARGQSGIENIWNDDRRGGRDDDDDMDMDDFIADEDEEEEGAGAMAEEEKEEKRRERRRLARERREMIKSRPELTGIDAAAWDEIHDVFGDGHDYDWALMDDEEEPTMDNDKEATKFADVFEPTAIKDRMLTEDDDIVRARDVPERMQLSCSTMSPNITIDWFDALTVQECSDAASWITPKLGGDKELKFFRTDGEHYELLAELVEAVTHVLEFLFINNYEVPYIYMHRRDYLLESSIKPNRVELLSLDDLWQIYQLGLRFRSLCQRRRKLQKTYEALAVHDEFFEKHIMNNLESVEAVVDATQWLHLQYKEGRRETFEMSFYGEENTDAATKTHKKPSRSTPYDLAKNSITVKVVEGFGIKSHEIVENFVSSSRSSRVHHVSDNDLPPVAFAEQFQDPDPVKALAPEVILRQARMLMATELGMDPLLRNFVRGQFRFSATVSCHPTEKGKGTITESNPRYSFKYLKDKPVSQMLNTAQFIRILDAERQNVVNVSIVLPFDAKDRMLGQILDAFQTEGFSETSQAWNDERRLVVEEALDTHLIPMGMKWIREHLRDECEEKLSKKLYDVVTSKVNVAPFRPANLDADDIPTVLAASWGNGDPKKDEINLVYLDEFGRMREHIQIDNLEDTLNVEPFRDLVRRRKPDVVVVGGYNMNTAKLSRKLKDTLLPSRMSELSIIPDWTFEAQDEPAFHIPVIYMYDQVAHLYQHSKRAATEFPELTVVGRFCVGLARYTQSPVNEFAAIGADLSAVSFDPDSVLLPVEKKLVAIERALVNVVNKVGIDINRAVNEPYYAHMLPFVSGLGPRKAQALIKKVLSIGGTLVNREHFVKQNILTTSIFINTAGFLRIEQDSDYKDAKSRGQSADYSDSPDPLDDTRVHPEDYDLARKMATDALELDEEDVADEHPSAVITQLMKDPDNIRKLDELNLDEFAISMKNSNNDLKRFTLDLIKGELIHPFGEERHPFTLPDKEDVLSMLAGVTPKDLRVGYRLTVVVNRIQDKYLTVDTTFNNLEGTIIKKEVTDRDVHLAEVVRKGQAVDAVILEIKRDIETDDFSLEMTMRDMERSDEALRATQKDSFWDDDAEERDREAARRRRNAEKNLARRIVKHILFHDFNSAKAEAYLEDQHPGDVVIRPSSKGQNHMAVTWKVADRLYQHIDVLEPNATIADQQVGGQLIIDGRYEFTDFDDLIVNHVKPMAKRVEELMAHEKFKRDDDELHKFLTSFVAANPTKSIYGFSLNRRKPGHFNLCFLARKNSSIQTWPVRVAPEAFYLFDAAAAGVSELCDAFKVRYLHESQNASMGPPGGKTPYGAGRMTPGRTPGHMSSRHPGQTPRTLGSSSYTAPTSGTPMSTTSFAGSTTYGAPSTYGFQTPRAGGFTPAPAAGAPSGMNPQRASMIQQSGGWSSSRSGSSWN